MTVAKQATQKYYSSMESLVLPPSATKAIAHVEAWLAKLETPTKKAYHGAIARFARHIGTTPKDAWAWLLCAEPWRVNQSVHQWVAFAQQTLTAATINQTVSALSSALQVARAAGVSSNTIEVKRPRMRPYKESNGPGMSGLAAMMDALKYLNSPMRERDTFVLLLNSCMVLRRSEIVTLRTIDVYDTTLLTLVGGKRVPLTMPRQVKEAAENWLAVRPNSESDALLLNLDRRQKGRPMDCRSIHRILDRAAQLAGIGKVTPNSIRHTAFTTALDETEFDMRSVSEYKKHTGANPLSIYDDRFFDASGRLAQIVADKIETAQTPRLPRKAWQKKATEVR